MTEILSRKEIDETVEYHREAVERLPDGFLRDEAEGVLRIAETAKQLYARNTKAAAALVCVIRELVGPYDDEVWETTAALEKALFSKTGGE